MHRKAVSAVNPVFQSEVAGSSLEWTDDLYVGVIADFLHKVPYVMWMAINYILCHCSTRCKVGYQLPEVCTSKRSLTILSSAYPKYKTGKQPSDHQARKDGFVKVALKVAVKLALKMASIPRSSSSQSACFVSCSVCSLSHMVARKCGMMPWKSVEKRDYVIWKSVEKCVILSLKSVEECE